MPRWPSNCFKGNMDNPLQTLLLSWSSEPPSNRRFWLACLVNHGRPPEISGDRNLPARDDADTAATTIETIWTTMMMTGSITSNQNSLVIVKSSVINQLKQHGLGPGMFQHIRSKDIFLQENRTRFHIFHPEWFPRMWRWCTRQLGKRTWVDSWSVEAHKKMMLNRYWSFEIYEKIGRIQSLELRKPGSFCFDLLHSLILLKHNA